MKVQVATVERNIITNFGCGCRCATFNNVFEGASIYNIACVLDICGIKSGHICDLSDPKSSPYYEIVCCTTSDCLCGLYQHPAIDTEHMDHFYYLDRDRKIYQSLQTSDVPIYPVEFDLFDKAIEFYIKHANRVIC